MTIVTTLGRPDTDVIDWSNSPWGVPEHDRRATFGSGGAEPYARALRTNNPVILLLHETTRGQLTSTTTMDVARWNADADEVDLTLLRAVTGPVLDIGCGPGRMVRAAAALGLDVLGIDVSAAAVELARETGLAVVEHSVFDTVPGEGGWQTALLVDGNIGIGGDVAALLTRCRDLLAPDGEIVVELHVDADHAHSYTGTLVDSHGGRSAFFPWAEIGLNGIVALAAPLGLGLRQAWTLGGRSFCRLATTSR